MGLNKSPLPKTVIVRGCEIKRAPIGALLDAMDVIATLPGDLIRSCFPGMGVGDIYAAASDGSVRPPCYARAAFLAAGSPRPVRTIPRTPIRIRLNPANDTSATPTGKLLHRPSRRGLRVFFFALTSGRLSRTPCCIASLIPSIAESVKRS